jgi:hypothetical protein
MLPLKICFAERVAQVAVDLAKIGLRPVGAIRAYAPEGKLESDLVE